MYYILMTITLTTAKILGWVAPCICIAYWIVHRGLKTTQEIVPQLEGYENKSIVGKRYML